MLVAGAGVGVIKTQDPLALISGRGGWVGGGGGGIEEWIECALLLLLLISSDFRYAQHCHCTTMLECTIAVDWSVLCLYWSEFQEWAIRHWWQSLLQSDCVQITEVKVMRAITNVYTNVAHPNTCILVSLSACQSPGTVLRSTG